MNVWENAVITSKGIALLAKLSQGNTLTITKGLTGAGYVTPGLLQQQTDVTSPKQELSFRSASYPEEGNCKLLCVLTNDELSTGYTATQVGIYAEDPDEGEILYFIAQAASGHGTVVPSAAEMAGYSAEWSFYFQYGQADGVNVTVDPSNTVSQQEVEALLKGKAPSQFVMTLNYDRETDKYSIDKTFAELQAAYEAGSYIKLVTTNGMEFALLAFGANYMAYFAHQLDANRYLVGFKANGTVTYTVQEDLASHNTSEEAHRDIRTLVENAAEKAENAASSLAGKAEKNHSHNASEISGGTFSSDLLPLVPVLKGGTGATNSKTARENLGITPENIGAILSTLPTMEDADISISATGTGIKIERWTKDTLNTPYKAGMIGNREGVIITAYSGNLYATQLAFPLGGRGLYIRPNLAGSIFDWTEYGDFKSDGSKPITGKVLNMQDGRGCLEVNGNVIGMRVRETANDDSNSARLTLDNGYGLTRKLFLRITEDGVSTDYDIYGEHNFSNGAKIQTGSYVGTGSSGANATPMSITFSEQPKIVFIAKRTNERENSLANHEQNLGWVYGAPFGLCVKDSQIYSPLSLDWSGNTLTWYSLNSANNWATDLLNKSGITYNYYAIF